MGAIWKGSISLGLVNIPIALYPATRKEELRFRLLRRTDLSPVNYKRVAGKDGKEASWDDIVKGYEYDLVSVLQQSLERTGGAKKKSTAKHRDKHAHHAKKAA